MLTGDSCDCQYSPVNLGHCRSGYFLLLWVSSQLLRTLAGSPLRSIVRLVTEILLPGLQASKALFDDKVSSSALQNWTRTGETALGRARDLVM